MTNDLLKRLEDLPTLKHIPVTELKWLTENGDYFSHQTGLLAGKGFKIEEMWIILEGCISVRIDHGAGPKKVNTELVRGSVTGMLPYSRLVSLPGDLYVDEPTEVLSISRELFPEMINTCPDFTAHTVHSMIDRTRIHTTSALLDEKMVAMGKLAAGLAHELNNPASVAIRDAKMLKEGQDAVDHASRRLNKAGLDDTQFEQISSMRLKCMEMSRTVSLSAIERADLQDKISDWLEQHHMDSSYAAMLTDLAVTPDALEKLLSPFPETTAEPILQWVVARCSLDRLAAEIEQSTNQICLLVDAVKKFTHMDSLAQKELVNIESGICDAIKLLEAKSKAKNIEISIEVNKDLPGIYANGAELNQVWFSLLDNAIDAVPDSGKIIVKARVETNLLAVYFIDNGEGIAQDKISRIFDPFYTTKPTGQGTGLGLDISRRFVRAHRGDIYVRSKSGETEFCVTLPLNNN